MSRTIRKGWRTYIPSCPTKSKKLLANIGKKNKNIRYSEWFSERMCIKFNQNSAGYCKMIKKYRKVEIRKRRMCDKTSLLLSNLDYGFEFIRYFPDPHNCKTSNIWMYY